MSEKCCEISEASLLEENLCAKIDYCSRSISSESCTDSYSKEIVLSPAKEPFQYGDVNVENSKNVHLGPKNLYENCQIRVVNYLQDLSNIPNFPKESSETDLFQKTNSGVENKFKLWITKDVGQATIIFGVFFLLFIAIILLASFLNPIFSSVIESETTTETTTSNQEIISSTLPFPTTTDAPKKNKCPSHNANNMLISQSGLATGPSARLPAMVDREHWNATVFEYEPIKLENPEYVIVSHTLQRPCKSIYTCIDRVQELQNFDRNERKLDDIRYNYLIGPTGDIFEGRGWDVVGEHTDGYNNRSVGIAFIGDYNKYFYTHDQEYSFNALLDSAVATGKIIEDYKLIGRCQVVYSTDSPGTVYDLVTSHYKWISDPFKFNKK